MPARIPLDVDLEDKLLYGLTPTRLAYLVVALLAAFSLWSAQWASIPIRAATAIALLIVGVVAAWGRWRARAVDGWLFDVAVFFVATYRVRWNRPRLISRLLRKTR
jgi:PrgI family protein